MSFNLKVQELVIGYDKALLSPLTFEIASSNTLFVIGSNGKGKSCLGKTLLGLHPSHSGAIDGINNLLKGYMPQGKLHSDHLPLTVRDFLSLFHKDLAWAELLISRLDINPLLDLSVNILSFGQWQRVNLAQALLSKPKFLVIDEPAQGLDLFWQEKIYNVVCEYTKIFDALCICISHDTLAINTNADYILCLDHLSFTKNHHAKTDGHSPAFTLLNHQHHNK